MIYDLDIYADADGVWQNDQPLEALVYGDIHERNIDPGTKEATWGEGGLVDRLRPRKQVFHDLFDMESRSHHNRRDPHVMYWLWKNGRDIVWDEMRDAGEFLDFTHRDYGDFESEEYVIDDNHGRHVDRWLKEADWRQDLPNARTILELNKRWLDAIDAGEEDDFVPLETALRLMGYGEHARFMSLDSKNPDRLSLVVCPAHGGGIELAHHGDLGPGGSRGSAKALSKLGRKNVVGHSHAPGIWGGTYVAGVTGNLRMKYNRGPSAWAHAHVAIYPNGKRQVLLFWKDMAHAPR